MLLIRDDQKDALGWKGGPEEVSDRGNQEGNESTGKSGSGLRVRKEQMEVLSGYCGEQFLERLFCHVTEVFSKETADLEEARVREIIGAGFKRAGEYGFLTEYDVARYVDLVFIFGADFDGNAEMPWAGEILRDNSYDSATSKMDHLVEVAVEYCDEALS